MKKSTDIAQVTTKGGFHLLWGLVISTIISSVGTIFIARLMGADLYGLYGIALGAPAFIAVFRNWSVHDALIRCTAQCRAENRMDEIRSIFMSGLIFDIALSLILSIISLAFSNVIAINIYNRPNISFLIQIASISILTQGIINAATAIFVGMDLMKLNSIMVIVQSILRTLLVIAFVIAGLATSGAIIGYTASTVFAGLLGIALIWAIYKNLPKPATAKLQLKAYLTTMLQYSIPVSISILIISVQAQFFTFLLPIHYTTDNAIIGNYTISANFIVLITFFATPITTMLFPAFSKFSRKEERETLQNFFRYSVKYGSLLVLPVAFLVISLAEPAVSTLFGNTYNSAPLFLALLALTYVYTAFGSLSIDNLIKSQGHIKYYLILTSITACIALPVGAILILYFGVLGLLITGLTTGVPGLILGLRFIQKNYNVTIDWSSSIRIIISSLLPTIVAYLVVSNLALASWIRLIIGVITFIMVLTLSLLFTKAITRSDINNLRELTSNFGPVTSISDMALKILQKLMDLLRL